MDTKTSQAWAAAASKATAVLNQLTQTEKIHLLSGRDFARIPGNARLKVPCLKTGDGPNGVRGASVSLDQVVGFPFHPTGKTAAGSAMFPCAAAVAATWSPQTAERAGEGIARDGWSKSVHMILAPTINMVRDPRNGRAFECFSEDPILTYYMGASWTVGAQEKAGVPVTLKHFVCNECETARHLSNVILGQKTLREVYARPFELIIRQLRKTNHIEPAAIMMAYNSVQGRSCSANKMLIKKLLRDEFGFHGLVMSDWFGTYVKASESMKAGLDIEMPGPSFHRSETSITTALQEGSLDRALIDQCASKVLQTAFFAQDLSQGAYRFFCEDELDKDIETSAAAAPNTGQPSSAELSEQMRAVAAEATVLLKNAKGLLPLDASRLRSVVVIGDPAVHPLTSGGGSANMPSYYETPALDALKRALPDADIQWFRGCKLTSKLPSLSGTQLADERVTMTWHGVDTATDVIEDEILHTSEHSSTELRGFLGGYQADSAYFAIRTSFAVVPKTTGLHKMSFQAFGSLEVSIKEGAGHARTLVQFDYDGENDLPTFMFNPERIRRVEQLQLTAGVPIQVSVEYKTPKHPKGFLPSHNAAFRVGYEEAYDEAALIDAAASAAATADVAIVFTGTGAEYESEGNDRSDILLPGHQNALVAAVGAATSNTIVVNASGSAVSSRGPTRFLPLCRHGSAAVKQATPSLMCFLASESPVVVCLRHGLRSSRTIPPLRIFQPLPRVPSPRSTETRPLSTQKARCLGTGGLRRLSASRCGGLDTV
ncbi:unnamed protein product [Jaminaea pallidilutea]